jgi:hypothetical protein
MLELFGPDGARLGVQSGGLAARVDVQAPASGTYTALISDFSSAGGGSYELRLAQVPGGFAVPEGDDGGALVDAQNHDGTILLGDLDFWSFPAGLGDRIGIELTELSGGVAFTPMVALFGPDGRRMVVQQHATTVTLDTVIETSGTYTVLVSGGARSDYHRRHGRVGVRRRGGGQHHASHQ